MATSDDQPARDLDREAAVRAVESAWADGQIVEADRDQRIQGLRHARTMREVELLVHDLRAPSYEQVPAEPVGPDPVEESSEEEPVVVIAPPATTKKQKKQKPADTRPVPAGAGCLMVLAVVAVIAATIFGIVVAIDDAVTGDAVTDSPTLAPGVEAESDQLNLFTQSGYDAFLTDLEDGTGGTVVFSAVLYPTYAVADVPVDDRSQREQSYYWNGELDEPGSKGTSSEQRYDLREIDWPVVIRTVERVRRRVEDPTTWYVILHAPREDDQSVIQAYASNEYGESAYVLATRDGTVTYRSDPPAGG